MRNRAQRLQFLIYVWCFILLLSSITTRNLMDICLVSLRLQFLLPNVFIALVVMVVLPHHNNLHPHLILCLQHSHLNQYHS